MLYLAVSQTLRTTAQLTDCCSYWSDTNPHLLIEGHTERPQTVNVRFDELWF